MHTTKYNYFSGRNDLTCIVYLVRVSMEGNEFCFLIFLLSLLD